MRNTRSSPWLGRAALFAGAVAAASGLVGGITLDPDLTNRVRDDAFYEFAWAANMAAGRGPTVSDGATTSGVQLAWSLLLVVPACCFGPGSLPWVAPWLGLVMHVATAWLWAARAKDRIAGACVGLCLLGNPLLVRECQNGQETALACLCLSALWLWRRAREPWFLGLAVVAVLARSELWLSVLALSVARHGVRSTVVLGAPVATLAVHVGCNLVLGGGWLPDSALPMAWLWHATHAAAGPDGLATAARTWWFTRPVLLGGPWALASAFGLGVAVFAVTRGILSRRWCVAPAVGVAIAVCLGAEDIATAAWAALLLAALPAAGRRPPPRELTLLLGSMVGILILHWAIRWYPRDYYAAPLAIAAAAAVLRFGRYRAVLLAAAVVQVADRRVVPEPLGGQIEMAMAGRFLGDVLPVAERVGCFNSGIVTFFADVSSTGSRRGVVNLDGVVDGRAFAALQDGRLDDWLDAEGVRFLLDNPVQFSTDVSLPHACGRWFGPTFDPARDLVEVARFDALSVDGTRPGTEAMRLFWRRGRGLGPAPPTSARDLGPAPEGGRFVLWPARSGQRLEAETEDGGRALVATADADAAYVLLVPAARVGTGRLFGGDFGEPLLTLSRL